MAVEGAAEEELADVSSDASFATDDYMIWWNFLIFESRFAKLENGIMIHILRGAVRIKFGMWRHLEVCLPHSWAI